MNKNKHLTLDNRHQIQRGLELGLSFRAIGTGIGKNNTTISKEIRGHIIFKRIGAPYRPFNDCQNRTHCKHSGDLCIECSRGKRQHCATCGKCSSLCSTYQKEECPHLLKPPYVCNGCSERNACTLEKHLYDAVQAQKEYEEVRSESRSGFNITEEELKELDSRISPLLKQGQSLHHILVNNPDTISCCEKTAYIYADNGLFEARNIDMPRKVRFRPRKQKSVPLKVDKSCRIGRTYEDYLAFIKENPSLPVVELDSVEGVKGEAVLLTVHFVRQKLQLSFKRDSNNSKSVTDIFNKLYTVLGQETYRKLFPILLADNGTEFSDPQSLEFDEEGHQRSHVFYCHPSSPYEKGACEVNHEFIRKIIPKGTDIGKYSEAQIHQMMNHINSYSRPELGDKTPYSMFEFYYGKKVLDQLGVQLVPPNEIVLKPSLLSGAGMESRDSTLGAQASGQPLTE